MSNVGSSVDNLSDLLVQWTTTITVRWRPSPTVYRSRITLLELLEDQKRIEAFDVREDSARAMLNRDLEMLINPGQITLACSAGRLDLEVAVAVFEAALQQTRPRITGFSARFQHVAPLEGVDYKTARSVFSKNLYGDLAQQYKIDDTAVLIDGAIGDGQKVFQAEFGVVDDNELSVRLGQDLGRLHSPDQLDFSHIDWSKRGLPDTSIYLDSTWHSHEKIPHEVKSSWWLSQLELYESEAANLTKTLCSKVDTSVSNDRGDEN